MSFHMNIYILTGQHVQKQSNGRWEFTVLMVEIFISSDECVIAFV